MFRIRTAGSTGSAALLDPRLDEAAVTQQETSPGYEVINNLKKKGHLLTTTPNKLHEEVLHFRNGTFLYVENSVFLANSS